MFIVAYYRYGVGVSQDHMIEKLLDYVPMLLNWVEQFMSRTPMAGRGEIEFRRCVSSCDPQYCSTLIAQDPKL